MNNNYFYIYKYFFLLLVFQLFVADIFSQRTGILFFLPILSIIWLPREWSFLRALPLVLLNSLLLDLFHHTLGLHLMSGVFLLYGREYALYFLLSQDEDTKHIHIRTLGWKIFFNYILLLNLIFYVFFFSIAWFNTDHFWAQLKLLAKSVFCMSLLCIFLDYTLMNEKK